MFGTITPPSPKHLPQKRSNLEDRLVVILPSLGLNTGFTAFHVCVSLRASSRLNSTDPLGQAALIPFDSSLLRELLSAKYFS